MTLTPGKLKELLERARAKVTSAEQASLSVLSNIIQKDNPDAVSFTTAGISDNSFTDPATSQQAEEDAVEIIRDIASNMSGNNDSGHSSDNTNTLSDAPDIAATHAHKEYGVAKDVTLNSKQQEFHDLVLTGADCILIGPAGTGKTTSMKQTTRSLMDIPGRLPTIGPDQETKWLKHGAPGAAILSYTRKAVNNIRHAVAEELKRNTLTIHKLLEFAPVIYEIEDPEDPGQFKKTMVFEPKRNAGNPLPSSLIFIAHEESSMESTSLYKLLEEALPHQHQEIFLGDIQQLTPIFGPAILGFKMIELPIVELTEVYRQALDSPILDLAHKIIRGDTNEFSSEREQYTHTRPDGKKVVRYRVPAYDKLTRKQIGPDGSVLSELVIHPWQKKLSVDDALPTIIKQFTTWADAGYYNPDDDIILCPFNKALGTIEVNKGIAQHLGIKRGAIVHEVIAGFNKHYLAVGDRVLYDKEDAYITSINKNGSYLGVSPKASSIHLDRWGHQQLKLSEQEKLQQQAELDEDLDHFDLVMEAAAAEVKDRVTVSSHVVTIQYAYGDTEQVSLDSAAEINNLLGGYCITFHKFQGSEVERGFILLHNSHAVMNSRELLYTGVTRYKKFLHVICEPDTFEKGVASQRIKGNTLAEKAEVFKGKIEGGVDIKETYKNGGNYVWDGPLVPDPAGTRPEGGNGANTDNTDSTDDSPSHSAIHIEQQPDKPKQTIIRWEDYINPDIIQEANDNLDAFWNKAKGIYGESLGPRPRINFNLHVHNTLGQAYEPDNQIRLNCLWSIAAARDPIIKHEMLEVTLYHEACHIIATRFANERAHGAGWVTAMKLMGQAPDIYYDDNTLPNWADTYRDMVRELEQDIKDMKYATYSPMNATGRNERREDDSEHKDLSNVRPASSVEPVSTGRDKEIEQDAGSTNQFAQQNTVATGEVPSPYELAKSRLAALRAKQAAGK